MLGRRKAFLHKVETIKGTDSVPTPADDLIVISGDANISVPTEQDEGTDDLKGTMGPGDSVTTKQGLSIEISTRIRGMGQGAEALLAPSIHAALMASGHKVTASGDGSVTPRKAVYVPTSNEADIKSATGYFYEDGLLYKLLGAVNNLSFSASMDALKASFSVQAGYTVPAPAAFPTITLPSEKIYRMTSALCVVSEDATPIQIGSFTFDPGVDVQENNETGQHDFEIANRNPVITIDPRAVANVADWTALTNCTSFAIVATFTNSIGETLVFTAPKAVLKSNEAGDRAGKITRNKTFSLKETAGDDQYSIDFTSVL